MSVDRGAYRFFRQHGGSRVGHNAEDALALARAEEQLRRAEALGAARVRWEPEEWWDYADLHGDMSAEEIHAKFQHGEWTGPFVCLLEPVGYDLVSLGLIVLGPHETVDPYCRVVEAELASEAQDELRQSIGDALDSRQPVLA